VSDARTDVCAGGHPYRDSQFWFEKSLCGDDILVSADSADRYARASNITQIT